MADDAPPPNLPNRFVSQTEIDQVNARKEEAWKAVYERIGMEPPASLKEKEEVYDGRSLAEVRSLLIIHCLVSNLYPRNWQPPEQPSKKLMNNSTSFRTSFVP